MIKEIKNSSQISIIKTSACLFLLAVLTTCTPKKTVSVEEETTSMQIPISDHQTSWWAGIIREGHKMPLQPGYEADMFANCWRNQLQPLLLSNTGELVWSEEPFRFRYTDDSLLFDRNHGELQYKKAGETLREAYLYASQNYFPPSGKLPDELFFEVPQYNTWIELTYNQNQEDVLKYANGIVDNGLPAGILMIDDNWQEDYGKWDFHQGRFKTPKLMIDNLHNMGFKVMMWVCPFVSPDSDVYRELEKRGLFLKDDSGKPAMVRWWNGVSAELDLSNPEAVKWFKQQLDYLMEEYGVDGFKLDAGDSRFYKDLKAFEEISPNAHTELFGKIGLDYPLNEYRAMWKMGGQPLVQRLHDKNHDWADLQKLIPHILLEGLMGYPFTCPDMIGGGQFTSFLDDAVIDQELVVRSAQIHALMPMMQFSVAPWRILDKRHFSAVKAAVQLRDKYKDKILELAREAAQTGEPITRSMEYVFPNQGYANITDQFLIGDDLLVAPFLAKGEGARKVVLPTGSWQSDDGKKYEGGKTIEIEVALNRLPYFIKIN